MRNWSISTKWLLLQSGVFLGLLSAAAVLLYHDARHEALSQLQSSASVTVQGFSEVIADNPGLMKPGLLQPSVWRFAAKVGDVDRMSVVDRSLEVVADSIPQHVGSVTDQSAFIEVLRAGQPTTFRYEAGGREHLIPAVPDIVLDVDVAAGRVVIRPPDGLLDL